MRVSQALGVAVGRIINASLFGLMPHLGGAVGLAQTALVT